MLSRTGVSQSLPTSRPSKIPVSLIKSNSSTLKDGPYKAWNVAKSYGTGPKDSTVDFSANAYKSSSVTPHSRELALLEIN